jgi:hypothetical protein
MAEKNIYQIISAISKEAGPLAAEKSGGVPFAFRGINAVVDKLAPLLNKYEVITVPEVLEHKVTSNPSGNKVVTTTEILAHYHFYAPDGTKVTATTAGLANDYADRSSAQAQSVAFRTALLQTFTLPSSDPEPEQTGVEREAPSAQPAAAAKPPVGQQKSVSSLVEEIKAIINDPESGYSASDINALGLEKSGGDGKWKTQAKHLEATIKAVKAGERA